ncbi:MAG: LysR family transcriptional regulator [Pseudonocardia sp.]|nr:LysR family transcriptional regulator [Pseudonocardia sp.]
MDARRLLIFRSVARTGSIAAAARGLGWTQPAVSQHLRALEREVRCPLVLREPRGVRLTDAGRALLAHADALAARLHSAEEELAAFAQLRAGTVRLAAFPSASATIVPRALAMVSARYPGLDVQLQEAEPPEALDRVRAGEADLAVVFAYPETEPVANPELDAQLIADDPIKVVVPAGHPVAGHERIELAALRDERWVAGCARCSEHLRRVCAEAGFAPDARHTTDDYVVAQALVAEGLAVTLLPELALRSYRHPDVAVLDAATAGSRQLLVLHHREAVRTPATAAVVAALTAGRSEPG